MNPGPRDLQAPTGFSNAGYVLRLQPFSALGYLVGHLVAFFEGLEPLSGNARMVHEDVFAPIIRADEAVALLVAEPLARSFLGHTFAPAFLFYRLHQTKEPPFSTGWRSVCCTPTLTCRASIPEVVRRARRRMLDRAYILSRLHEPLQQLYKFFDLFLGVVRSQAGPDPSSFVPNSQLLGERRGVEVPVGDEVALFRHVLAELSRCAPFYPEREGWGLGDAVRGGIELDAGDLAQRRAELLGQLRLVLFDGPHPGDELVSWRSSNTQGRDEAYRSLHAGDALVVLGAGFEPVRDVVWRRFHLVDAHGFEEVALYDRRAHVRPEELVGGAGEEVGAQSVTVHGDVRGGVHGIHRDERAGLVGQPGYGGYVGDRADGVRRQANGDELGLIVDRPFYIVRVEGERLGVDPDPPYPRLFFGGGEEPRVHVRAV